MWSDVVAQEIVDVEGIVETIDVERITGWNMVAATAVFIAAIIVGRLLMTVTRRALGRIEGIPDFAGQLIGRLVFYLVLLLGGAWALTFIGVNLLPLLTSLGVLVIILAFALRGIVENFAAGLTLQARGPFRPGDQIDTNGHTGTVVEINARAVVLDTTEGTRVHVPSGSVLGEPIVNYTVLEHRRTTLDIGLAYDTDLEAARRLILETVTAVDGVLGEPPPDVLVHEFADSTIDVAVRFWHSPQLRAGWVVRDAVAVALKAALDGAGMNMAFPQRVLWWGTEAEAGTGPPART